MTFWNIQNCNNIIKQMAKSIYTNEQLRITALLKTARFEAGLKQADAAKIIGKTQSYISKIESGQRRFDVLQLKEFAKIYNKPLGYFIK